MTDPTYYRFDAGGAPITEAHPLPVALAGGSSSGDMTVVGPDAADTASTKPPVQIAGVDENGVVRAIRTVGHCIQTISESPEGQPADLYGIKIHGMDPDTNAKPFSLDDNGYLFVVPMAVQFWPETSTPLAASATFNGASRDGGAASPGPLAAAYFNGMIYADQVGTATIERSNDGTNWTPAATAAIVATTPLTLQIPVVARYHRIVVENGGTAQAVLSVNSSYTAS